MKLVFSLCLLVLNLELACAIWRHSVDESVKKSPSWFEWFSLTFYKGFYVVLMSAILCCTVFNFMKNKMVKNGEGKVWSIDAAKTEPYSNVLSFMEPGMNTCLTSFDKVENQSGDFSESESQLRQRLLDAQEEIQSLRGQLTTSLDTKTELESTVAMMDKEKITVEMHLELDRVHGAVELEKLRKDNLAMRREIEKLLEDKEEAEKEAERLDRDARISRSAVVDSEFLEERLGSVKKEAELLKRQFSLLAQEKVRATSVLSEIPHLPSSQNLANETRSVWAADTELLSIE